MTTVLVAEKERLLKKLASDLVTYAVHSFQQKKHSPVRLVLGGGQTQACLNADIVKELWQHTEMLSSLRFLLTDERYVPENHSDSNKKLIWQTLLQPLKCSSQQLLAPDCDRPLSVAMEMWNDQLADLGGLDLALLGVGPDGHTASLFPGFLPLPWEVWERVQYGGRGPEGHHRISLSPHFMASAHEVWFVVTGEAKAWALRNMLISNERPFDCPTHQVLKQTQSVRVYADVSAISMLGIKEDYESINRDLIIRFIKSGSH